MPQINKYTFWVEVDIVNKIWVLHDTFESNGPKHHLNHAKTKNRTLEQQPPKRAPNGKATHKHLLATTSAPKRTPKLTQTSKATKSTRT